MTLLKELINRQVNEAPELAKVDTFHKRMTVLDGHIDQLEMSIKEGSQFEQILKDVDADMSYFKDMMKALKQLRIAFDDMHMSTDMRINRGDD